MKRFHFTVLFFLGQIFSLATNAETYNFRADSWCPYTCTEDTGKKGYMVDVLDAVFEASNDKVDFKILNWARSIEETRKGKYLGIVGASKLDAPDFVFPKEPIGRQKMCFFTLKTSDWKFESIDSLKKILLGTIIDYSYSEDVDAYIKANANDPKKIAILSGESPLEMNVKKLMLNRIGAFIDDENATNFVLNTVDGAKSKIKEVGCAKSSDLFVALSPKNPRANEFANTISEKITQFRKNGKLKKILDKYEIKDWK